MFKIIKKIMFKIIKKIMFKIIKKIMFKIIKKIFSHIVSIYEMGFMKSLNLIEMKIYNLNVQKYLKYIFYFFISLFFLYFLILICVRIWVYNPFTIFYLFQRFMFLIFFIMVFYLVLYIVLVLFDFIFNLNIKSLKNLFIFKCQIINFPKTTKVYLTQEKFFLIVFLVFFIFIFFPLHDYYMFIYLVGCMYHLFLGSFFKDDFISSYAKNKLYVKRFLVLNEQRYVLYRNLNIVFNLIILLSCVNILLLSFYLLIKLKLVFLIYLIFIGFSILLEINYHLKINVFLLIFVKFKIIFFIQLKIKIFLVDLYNIMFLLFCDLCNLRSSFIIQYLIMFFLLNLYLFLHLSGVLYFEILDKYIYILISFCYSNYISEYNIYFLFFENLFIWRPIVNGDVFFFTKDFHNFIIPLLNKALVVIFFFWIVNILESLLIVFEINYYIIDSDSMFKKMNKKIILYIKNNLNYFNDWFFVYQFCLFFLFLMKIFPLLFDIIYGFDILNESINTLTSLDYCLQIINHTWYKFLVKLFGETIVTSEFLYLPEINKYILLRIFLNDMFLLFCIFIHICIIYFFVFWTGLKIK